MQTPIYVVVEDFTPEFDSKEELERFDSTWSTRDLADERAWELSQQDEVEGRVIESFLDVSGE